MEIAVSFWEIGLRTGTGETALPRLVSETWGHQLRPLNSGRPSRTVVVFQDWTVIVCEVGGADKVCENKIPLGSPVRLFV